MVLNVEELSSDGAWAKVTVAPEFTGWVSMPVLLKVSTDTGAAGAQLPLQQVLLLITGLSGPPYVDEMTSYSRPGKPFQVLKRTFTYKVADDCHIDLTTTYVQGERPRRPLDREEFRRHGPFRFHQA
jgi:hypothetical protein